MTECFMETSRRIAEKAIEFLQIAGKKPVFHVLASTSPDSVMDKIYPGLHYMTLDELQKKHLSPAELENAAEYRDLPLWLELLDRAKNQQGDFVFCIPWDGDLASIDHLSHPCRAFHFSERMVYLSRSYAAHSSQSNSFVWLRNREVTSFDIIQSKHRSP